MSTHLNQLEAFYGKLTSLVENSASIEQATDTIELAAEIADACDHLPPKKQLISLIRQIELFGVPYSELHAAIALAAQLAQKPLDQGSEPEPDIKSAVEPEPEPEPEPKPEPDSTDENLADQIPADDDLVDEVQADKEPTDEELEQLEQRAKEILNRLQREGYRPSDIGEAIGKTAQWVGRRRGISSSLPLGRELAQRIIDTDWGSVPHPFPGEFDNPTDPE